MGSEARVVRSETASAISSRRLSSFVAETSAASFAQPADSLPLQPLRRKAPPASSRLHDDDTPSALSLESSPESNLQNMSRAPLLVRSSPAQGTGSYGGLPILSVSSSPDDSDHHVTSFLERVHRKKKGKSKLRHSEPDHIRRTKHADREDSVEGRPASNTENGIGNGGALLDDLVGKSEPLLEARFNTGALPMTGISAPRIFHSLNSSSTSGQSESEDSEDEDLHDAKANGHPSDNSPYAQVRAAVGASDDPTLSINTPRMWALSILFAILGSSTNLFFSLRYPSVSITPIIALLLVHPLGLLWDQMLKHSDDPFEVYENGVRQTSTGNGTNPAHLTLSRRTRFRLWLAQGRWNLKEHCCVYISSNVSFGFAFATDVSVH